MGLSMPFGREVYPVIGDGLVDFSILVSLGLSMADQNDHLSRDVLVGI